MALGQANTERTPEINRGYLHHIRVWSGAGVQSRWKALRDRLCSGNVLRGVLFPLAILTAAILRIALGILARRRPPLASPLHRSALEYVDTLVTQYPLHLYPVVAKALELAYLRSRLAALSDRPSRILEIAIGEGTLSARVFGAGAPSVTGIDLNPYSLHKASRLPHVARAIVADGLNPPVRPGTFDLLLATNFLHHVSQKDLAIANWSRLAERLLFNENTPSWASGWAVPYLLRRIGFASFATRRAHAIALQSLQHLEHLATLERRVRSSCDLLERTSFMSERTFFLASIFSFLMRCYGPPTPPLLKRWSLGPLRGCVVPLTAALARRLIEFDAQADRSSDTFVMFLCRSRDWHGNDTRADLLCPNCRAVLDAGDGCPDCGAHFSRRDGMLFLLPKELEMVAGAYRSEATQGIPDEHL